MWFIYSIYLLLGCAQHTQYDWYKILSFHHFLPFSNMNQNVIATPTPYLDAIERNNLTDRKCNTFSQAWMALTSIWSI